MFLFYLFSSSSSSMNWKKLHNSVEKNIISELEIGCHLHVLQLATGQIHWIVEHKALNTFAAES